MIFVEELLMKKFLAKYLGSASAIANEKVIVDQGSPLGKTKRISAQGVSDTRNEIAAYTIIEAESHEAAAKMFENHPHFMIFPGHSVEVMECLPMP